MVTYPTKAPMSYYATYIVVCISFILLSSLLLGFTLRKRRESTNGPVLTFSTADFLPIICCIFVGLIVGQLADFILSQQIGLVGNEAVSDGLSSGIMVTAGTWGIYWYKTRK